MILGFLRRVLTEAHGKCGEHGVSRPNLGQFDETIFLRMMHQRDRVNVRVISTSGALSGYRSMRFTIARMSFSTSGAMFG
jgi:hypothetical protein